MTCVIDVGPGAGVRLCCTMLTWLPSVGVYAVRQLQTENAVSGAVAVAVFGNMWQVMWLQAACLFQHTSHKDAANGFAQKRALVYFAGRAAADICCGSRSRHPPPPPTNQQPHRRYHTVDNPSRRPGQQHNSRQAGFNVHTCSWQCHQAGHCWLVWCSTSGS